MPGHTNVALGSAQRKIENLATYGFLFNFDDNSIIHCMNRNFAQYIYVNMNTHKNGDEIHINISIRSLCFLLYDAGFAHIVSMIFMY